MAKKYHEFNAGRAGNGTIDLATGKLTFIHQNTDAESTILPVSISHVYQSDKVSQQNNLYGRGWKLNLNQTLHKVLPNNPNDTRYIYTDGSGVEHEFEQKYFYRIDKERQFYLPNTTTKIKRSDIRIDLDNRMWLISDESIEIFSELVTDSGLTLQVKPEGYLGSEKIETRHEELIRVEQEIKNFERQIRDIEDQINQNSDLEQVIRLEVSNVRTLQDLQNYIQSLSNSAEELAIRDFDDGIDDQDYLLARQAELRYTTAKDYQNDVQTIIPNSHLTNDSVEGNNNIRFEERRIRRWSYNNDHARWVDSISSRSQFWAGEGSNNFPNTDTIRRGRALAHYQRLYQEAVEKIQARIQNVQVKMETRNWKNVQRTNEERAQLLQFQTEFQQIQEEFNEKRTSLLLERWDEDLIELRIQLARTKHTRKQLINLLPVNYIIDDNILGFNEDGNLVAIFDNYDNQIAILYEDERIIRVIDSEERTIEFEYISNRLDHIKDFQERVIYFKYIEGELQEIIYPNREVTSFKYNSNQIITDVLSPSKIGKRLVIDDRNRVDKIINLSLAAKISSDGIEIGEDILEDLIIIAYNSLRMQTEVINPRTKEQVTYFFNEYGEVIHEHLEGKFEQSFRTYYEGEYQEVGIEEVITNKADISQIKEKHIEWLEKPDTLPQYDEKLTWSVVYLDVEGNPIKRNFSETSLPSDSSIRQRVEETFSYKRFIDGRQPLLVRNDTLITTTNKPDRLSSEEYFYNKQGSIIRTVSSPDQMVEETGYNNKGIVINSVVYNRINPDKRFVEKLEVNEEGQVTAAYDESGQHKTTYDYIKNTSKVKRTTDPRGGRVVLGRDFATNKINSMSSASKGERNATTYHHTADFLTKLESANTSFEYTYDGHGRTTAIYVNGEVKPYLSYNYSLEKRDVYNDMGVVECDVVTTTYASDEVYINYTDKFGRLLAIHYKSNNQVEQALLTNFYEDNKIIKTLDYKTNETILFEYDIRGNVVKQTVKGIFKHYVEEVPAQYLSISQDINIDGAIDKLTYEIDNRNQTYKFDYQDDLLAEIQLPSKDILKLDADEFERARKIFIMSNDKKILREECSFLQYSDRTTNLVNSHTQRIGDDIFNKTFYTYDERGNIAEIRQAGQIIVKYDYDELNRLVREDNRKLDKSYTFEYDNNSNIFLKKEFPFTLDKLIDGTTTNYIYSDEGDQLIRLNDQKFEYDILGNPMIYRNNDLKWSHLRNLEKFNDIEFKYDSANLRVYKNYQKLIDGNNTRIESRYQWANDKLISETRTLTTNEWLPSSQPVDDVTNDLRINTTKVTLDFIYGNTGKIGFTLNNKKTYYYVKNIQGDVTKVIDNEGNVVAEYNYDAWGNHEIITSVDGIAELNPIRYKSYYFDGETGLYYLKSRYYDAQIGRFINMDALRYTDPDNIGGLNLYAYCGNNPVMYEDPEGTFFRRIGSAFVNAARNALGNPLRQLALGLLGAAAIGLFAAAVFLTGGALLIGAAKLLKIAGPLALKGAKALGGAVKAGAKKFGTALKKSFKDTATKIKMGIGAAFGAWDSAWDSDGNFNFVRGFVGGAIGATSALIGGIFKESRFLVKAGAGAILGLASWAGKSTIKGSFDVGSMVMSIITGTIGAFLDVVSGTIFYILQMVSGAVTVNNGVQTPNGHRSNRLAH